MRRSFPLSILVVALGYVVSAQEASSGLELGGTASALGAYSHQLSAEPRDGAPVTGGAHLLLYPLWKLSEHWSVAGAIQLRSRPYYYDELSTQGFGLNVDILQANLTYSRVAANHSVVVRVGQLSSAFGSFLLRYDDAVNPLIDKPLAYGYYYQGVTTLGLMGAQVDATAGKFDVRAQFVNSSPANRRSIFDHDQYGNWAGGIGYTVKQGVRIGGSVYRGPFLSRDYDFFFPGESSPRQLPATATGIDGQWGHGPWNVYGEWQYFHMDYHVIPIFVNRVGYAEVKRTLSPHWYVATRSGYAHGSAGPSRQNYEFAVGYRPNRFQLVKLDYEVVQGQFVRGTLANVLGIQFVTTFGPLSLARN